MADARLARHRRQAPRRFNLALRFNFRAAGKPATAHSEVIPVIGNGFIAAARGTMAGPGHEFLAPRAGPAISFPDAGRRNWRYR